MTDYYRDSPQAPQGQSPNLDLEIRRVENLESNKVGYFLLSAGLDLVAINESAIGANLIAGPLPDFAMITVGDFAAIWFRTLSARKYIATVQVDGNFLLIHIRNCITILMLDLGTKTKAL